MNIRIKHMHFGTERFYKRALVLVIFIFCVLLVLIRSHHHDEINLRTLLEVALAAAENGGREVVLLKDVAKVGSKGKTFEGMNDDVTTADYLSHCTMTETIRNEFPKVKLISEEHTYCDKKSVITNKIHSIKDLSDEWVSWEDVTVWIDPLDATHEYTEKLFQYVTTMVCVAVKGKPVLGVIHKPFSNETFWAWYGYGYSPNLHYKEEKRSKPRVIISRSHSGQITKVLKGNRFEVVEAAGAGYKVIEIATGRADAYVHITTIKKWDICAGNAILREVGGKMTTKDNEDLDYSHDVNVKNNNGLVATMEEHDYYISILKNT